MKKENFSIRSNDTMTLVIFLRGINVNGIKVPMSELKKLMENNSYTDVVTILASGNIIMKADAQTDLETHKIRIEALLRDTFQYDAHIIIFTKEAFIELYKEAKLVNVPTDCHHYILLTESFEMTASKLKKAFDSVEKDEQEKLVLGEKSICWIVSKGSTLTSNFSKQFLGKKEFKSLVTSRTLTTIEKMIKVI